MSTHAWREQPPAPAPVRPYAFPRVTRMLLDNGLTVLHARQGELPLVALRVVVRAGAAAEGIERAGLAQLTASALDAGTELHDGPALAWELERIGIELETEAGWDQIALGATVPSSRLDPALGLLAEIARRAAFAEPDVERMRGEQLGQILLRRTEPRALADDSALRFIFAEDTRYARPLVGSTPSVETLGAVDVTGFRDALFAPANAAVVVVGGLDPDAARVAVQHHFGDWAAAGATPPQPAVRPRAGEERVHVVHRAQAVQSEIRVGQTGVERAHPDHVPLLVMNAILGGMFTSRLNLNLRERHGFTYGVRSGFGFRRTGGTFLTATAVATDVTVRAVEEVLAELARMHDDGATDDEVAAARDYLSGVMPLKLQTAGAVADALTELFVHDLPDDWHQLHREDVAAVPPAEVTRVAREHLAPDAATIVVVGDAEPIRAGLEALGRGTVLVHAPE